MRTHDDIDRRRPTQRPVNAIASTLKMVLALAAVVAFFRMNALFTEYSDAGTRTADGVHVVVLNNHGHYSYITVAQSAQLDHLSRWSSVLFIAAVAIDLVQRHRDGKRATAAGARVT